MRVAGLGAPIMSRTYGSEKVDLKKMAHHHGSDKKELSNESLLHLHPYGTEEEIDKEWEEFARLMEKFKENRKIRYTVYVASPFFFQNARIIATI
jgi:hypothetical protein